MKKLTTTLLLFLLSLSSFAQTKSDTIVIEQSSITRWITDTTTSAKGKLTIKYYCVYKNELVSTNKTTFESVKLCKKHNVQCSLIYITSSTGRKRITIN